MANAEELAVAVPDRWVEDLEPLPEEAFQGISLAVADILKDYVVSQVDQYVMPIPGYV